MWNVDLLLWGNLIAHIGLHENDAVALSRKNVNNEFQLLRAFKFFNASLGTLAKL